MRYVYSVARFVPDPTRGEFVNIGLLVGSDDSQEWMLQKVSRENRARRIDENDVLPQVTARVTSIASMLDAFTDANESLFQNSGLSDISEDWLHELSSDLANVLQFTPPRPVVAESAQEATDFLWPQFIAEPEAKKRNFITKHRALAKVKESFRNNSLTRKNWKELTRLRTKNSHSQIDFAVHNGKVVHMTQCWSFQIANQ